tara:strand:- start:335 stop:508 length:174 start_codon:yes stop_codon:yes gene_type:complete
MNKEKVKDFLKGLMSDPFGTSVEISIYIVSVAAGTWCILYALGLAHSMLLPAVQRFN